MKNATSITEMIFVIILALISIEKVKCQIIINTTPSCEFKQDGVIDLIIDEDSINYDLPFTIYWENLTTGDYQDEITMDNYEFSLKDLFPGEYEITIYFTNNCKYYLKTEVENIENEELKFLRKPSQLICGLSNAKLTLFPTDGVPEFNFEWSNGATTYAVGDPPTSYYIDDLGPGNYCVTITDQECGYASFCTLIKEQFPIVTVDEINQITNCQEEPYDCTGKVTIRVFGVTIYTIEWLDPYRNIIGAGNSINDLCLPGSYLAKITFSPFCNPEIFEFIVPCCNDSTSDLTVNSEVVLGCENGIDIETNVSGGNPPYIYNWSNNSQEPNLYNVAYGEYKITVTDSIGCMAHDSVFMIPVETINVYAACEGIKDGAISFRINNPSNCPVNVTYDWSICSDCSSYPLIQNDTNSVIDVFLDELAGGIEYTYYVWMCGCIIPINFILPEDKFETKFIDVIDHGQWTFECIYDIDCKDTHVDSGVIALATLSLAEEVDCEGLFSKDCGSTKYYCEENLVGERGIKAKVMRRMRAVMLAQTLGYDPGVINGTVGDGNPCDWVSVCPNDPTCVHGTAHGEFGGHYLGPEPTPDGCTRIKCRIAGIISTSYKICGLDFVPDYYAAYYDPSIAISLNIGLNNCNPVEKNVGELIMYLDSLNYDYPHRFFYSGLFNFLLKHLADERKWCANVKYCTSDFSFISSNIGDVECEPIEPPLQTGGPGPIDRACAPYQGDNDVFYVFCHTECPSPRPGITCGPQPKVFIDDYGSFNPVGFSSNHPTQQLMARMNSSSSFSSFLPIKQDSNTYTVNALFKDSGVSLLHQFSYDKWYPYEFENLEFMFLHPDSSYAFAIEQDSQVQEFHRIFYGDIGDINETNLTGSSGLNLLKIWSNDSLNFITGNFNGDLELDGSTLATASSFNNQFFILNTDRYLDVIALRKINLNGWNVYVDEQSGDLAFWSPTSQGLYIDDQLQNNVSTREIITLDGANPSSSARDINLILSSSMDLLEYKRLDTYSAYLIAGTGAISLNGSQIYSDSTSKLILLTVSNLGSINWIKDYLLSSIDTSDISIETIKGDSIFLGLNMTDTISIGSSSIVNAGERDILILGYNSAGTLISNNHYGSPSDETMKDLFYSNGILYFGGELDAKTFIRQIGNLQFFNFSSDFSQGYISFILLDSVVQAEGLISIINQEEERDTESSVVEIYPNPANDHITIRVKQNCDQVQVLVRDLNGNILIATENNKELLSLGLSINISGINSGIYFVEVISKCSKLLSRPFIIVN